MSINTFLSSIWQQISSLFQKLPIEIQKSAHIAVSVAENIKTVVDSPAMDLLTAIIPGDLDDACIRFLRSRLPEIVIELRLADATLNNSSIDSVMTEASGKIKVLNGDIQNSALHSLGVLLLREISAFRNKTISWSDAVYIIEWYYKNKFGKARTLNEIK